MIRKSGGLLMVVLALAGPAHGQRANPLPASPPDPRVEAPRPAPSPPGDPPGPKADTPALGAPRPVPQPPPPSPPPSGLLQPAGLLQPMTPTAPPAVVLPPPSPVLPPEPRYVPDQPYFYRPPERAPGLYAALDAGLVGPHVKNRLSGTVAVLAPAGDPVALTPVRLDTVHLPNAELDWTVAPRFELGYRLADERGTLLVSYRFLQSEGTDSLFGFDPLGAAFLKSRLDFHEIDLDYQSDTWSPAPRWDLRWRAGVRLASLFFDSRAQGPFLGQRTSNHFFGAGPHVGLDAWRRLGGGLALFGRVEGASVLGRIHQSFEETFTFADGSQLGGASRVSQAQGLPVLNVQGGLSWAPLADRARFMAGYQYEHWWMAGQVGSSRAEVTDQGVFLRAEFNY